MKIFRYIAALLATTALTVLPTNAQFAAGELVGVSDFQSTDILATARNANSYTTARVAGMAGAFTSLGGDLASISINPAGLGMFRSSVLSLSPSAVGDNIFDAPIELDSRDLAFGIGFKVGRTSIDASFVNKQTNYSDYDLFYWDGGDGTVIVNDLISKNKGRKNIATVTLTIPF